MSFRFAIPALALVLEVAAFFLGLSDDPPKLLLLLDMVSCSDGDFLSSLLASLEELRVLIPPLSEGPLLPPSLPIGPFRFDKPES